MMAACEKFFIFLVAASMWGQTSPEEAPPCNFFVADSKLYWRYHHLAAVGYRRDRQKFHETDSTSRITDRNSMELILRSHLEIGHFVTYFQGNYGWLINGNFHDSSNGAIVGEPVTFGKYDLGAGYAADVFAALGLNFQIVDCPKFEMSFIPFGGYKYSHLMNFPEGEDRFNIPVPPVLLPAGTTGFALGRFPNPNQQDWFGFFAEGRLRCLFWDNFEWELFYQYHRPTVRSKLNEEIDLYLFNPPNTVIAIDLFRGSSIYKARVATKQVGGTNFRYHGKTGYNFGCHFEGSSAWTHQAHYRSKRRREQFILPPTGSPLQRSTTQRLFIGYAMKFQSIWDMNFNLRKISPSPGRQCHGLQAANNCESCEPSLNIRIPVF